MNVAMVQWLFWQCCLGLLIAFVLSVLSFVFACRFRAHGRRRARRCCGGQKSKEQSRHSSLIVAFFHPYCSSGGGGERVLWKIVQVLLLHERRRHEQERQEQEATTSKTTAEQKNEMPMLLNVIIYTVDPPSPTYKEDLLKHVKERFAIDLTTSTKQNEHFLLNFVHLDEYRHFLLPAGRLSLLVESIRSMQLAWKALTYSWDLIPDIFVDTTGYAFTYVVANALMGCRVWAYVHYPTISTDMLQMVWQRRRSAYNHAAYIAQSKLATFVKLVYYCLFAVLYGIAGSMAQVVLANSTWTYNHICSLWKMAAWLSRIQTVYPPCQVSEVLQIKQTSATASSPRQNVVLSIGQFRPEKDHVLQIETMARLYELYPQWKGKIKLVLLGSCRGESDEERLKYLQNLAKDKYQWTDNEIEFVVNQPYSVVQQWLSKSSMGIHTMWNEHFGIGIVEMMAAGLVVIAHNSGGPKSDIIVADYPSDDKRMTHDVDDIPFHPRPQRTGFLASTADEYAESIHQILTMDPEQEEQIRERARMSSLRFSDNVFAKNIERVLTYHLDPER
ncbi:hypothetical protein ACA910_016239 [Epithemia clementina (nom. ined.)]